jgi:hypothetical protein
MRIPAKHTEYKRLTSYFAPLALQTCSQSLCYPLVAMVASRAPGGPLNLAGLAQSNSVMFFLGIFAVNLVTTGMVYAETLEGYRRFRRVNLGFAFFAVMAQALLCAPRLSHWLFATLIGLPPSIEHPAWITLLASIPLQLLFFLRIPYQVAMYNGKATGVASLATVARIILTAVLSPLFCNSGLVGPLWAIVCLTLPVALETFASRVLAGPFIRRLNPVDPRPPSMKDMVYFTIPLSIGGYFLAISAVILGAFIARAPEPERMLPVYYLALGLATPVAYSATRLQALVLAFPPQSDQGAATFRFGLYSGTLLGLLPLIFVLPGVADIYYVQLQQLNPADLPLVRLTAVALIGYPLSVAIRAQREGLAAWFRKPATVLAGQAVFMVTMISVGWIGLSLDIMGCLIGPAGLTIGSVASAMIIRMSLHLETEGAMPIPPTTTSVGQIR